MSTYVNKAKGKSLNIETLDSPDYLTKFLLHILVIRGLTQLSTIGYYNQLRCFLRWIKCRGTEYCEETFTETSIKDVPFETIAAITQQDIHEYLAFCTGALNNNPKTRSLKLTTIRVFYEYLCDEKLIDTNPATRIKSPKLERTIPKYLTIEESKKLLSVVAGPTPERDYCIITLLLNCGMRLSELANIDLKHIREDTLRLFGKGQKERIVYLNDACINALNDYLTVRKLNTQIIDKDALLVSPRTGKRISNRRIQKIVEQNLMLAGLSGCGYSAHKLRHTAATLMYQSGSANLKELQALLGHESTATTEIYTHIDSKQLRQAVNSAPLATVKRKS